MDKYVSVHALNNYIKSYLSHNQTLQDVYLIGEISNYRPHSSGHMYFTLKDETAAISAIMFSYNAKKINFDVVNGKKVRVHGHVTSYEKTGNTQIIISEMLEDGIGDLAKKFEILKKKLAEEGLFDASHKKPIPSFPGKIAVLSAKQGAALQDVLKTINHRFPFTQVIIFPVPVQGKDAYLKIIETLKFVDKHHFSTIILARGGGSLEDLWNFNEEELVRTIYHLQTPIITGVGHETDFTLVDFVSDMRAVTPTGAAMQATPDQYELKRDIISKAKTLEMLMKRYITYQRSELERRKNYHYFSNPHRIYENELLKIHHYEEKLNQMKEKFIHDKIHDLDMKNEKITYLTNKLIHNQRGILETKTLLLNQNIKQYTMQIRNEFTRKIEKLDLVSPLKILTKGYSIVKKEGQVVKSKDQLKQSDKIQIQFTDGMINATVEGETNG